VWVFVKSLLDVGFSVVMLLVVVLNVVMPAGPIPSDVMQLTGLTRLALDANELTGARVRACASALRVAAHKKRCVALLFRGDSHCAFSVGEPECPNMR
jgi:hypothetical protein